MARLIYISTLCKYEVHVIRIFANLFVYVKQFILGHYMYLHMNQYRKYFEFNWARYLDQKRVDWLASDPEFDFHVRHILLWRLSHEKISTAILPLPLIQEEQLSVTGERMSTVKLLRRLAQEQCG